MIDNDEETPITASLMLSTARKALGLTQDEVAAQLYLTPSYIRIIDADELDKLPKPAFVRGYLRSYAKLVKLNGDDVVRQYENRNATAANQTIEIHNSTQKLDPVNFAGSVFQAGIIGLVILALIIASVWWFSSSDENPPMTVSQYNPNEEEPEVLQLPERTALDGAMANARAAGSMEAALIQVGDKGDESAVAEKLISISSENIDAINYITVDAGGDDRLKFVFTDDCWLEIEDKEGVSIFGDLGRAGDEIVVYGMAPFKLLFGKASAVTMRFNGSDVDLRSHTSADETAKVTVGRG